MMNIIGPERVHGRIGEAVGNEERKEQRQKRIGEERYEWAASDKNRHDLHCSAN